MTSVVVLQPWYTDPWTWAALALVGGIAGGLGALLARAFHQRLLAPALGAALASTTSAAAIIARYHAGWRYTGEEPLPLMEAMDAAGPLAAAPFVLAALVAAILCLRARRAHAQP